MVIMDANDRRANAAKIYLGKVEGAILVGQLVPPVVCLIPDSEIEAMHPIVGAIGGTLEMTERNKAALALIAPFVNGGAAQPLRSTVASVVGESFSSSPKKS